MLAKALAWLLNLSFAILVLIFLAFLVAVNAPLVYELTGRQLLYPLGIEVPDLAGFPLDPQLLIRLLTVFAATCALVIALYQAYINDRRLRSISENVFVGFIFFLIAFCILTVALLFSALPSVSVDHPGRGFYEASLRLSHIFAFIAIEIYVLNMLFMLWGVFLQGYNHIFNLRASKSWRYFKPIRVAADLVASKTYETGEVGVDITERAGEPGTFEPFASGLTEEELSRLKKGASILLQVPNPLVALDHVFPFLAARMALEEVINYVCCDRHPREVWDRKKEPIKNLKDFIFIDGFSPNYAFHDDIQLKNSRILDRLGLVRIPARSFPDLHSATSKAFNVTKKREQKDEKNPRRPLTIVYAHTSVFCDFESPEQFKIFWRHVTSSERSYGMLTVIVESTQAPQDLLGALKQMVDFSFKMTLADEQPQPGVNKYRVVRDHS